jgi:ribonuclease P protein component
VKSLELRTTLAVVAAQKNAGTRTGQPSPSSGAEGVDFSPAPSTNASFSRTSRLLKHASFQNVYNNGRRHFSPHMSVFYLMQDEDKASRRGARVGLTVGRVLGGAVVRNRIKRRMRDAVRQNLGVLNSALVERKLLAEVVINPKKAALKAETSILMAEVAKAFEVISKAPVLAMKIEDTKSGRRRK